MPWTTNHIVGFCGECDFSARAEMPHPVEHARVIRQTLEHERKTGHNTAIERGQLYTYSPPRR